MPPFHALFSAGGVAGSLIASASMAGGLGPTWHVALVAGTSVAVLAAALRWLLPSTPPVASAGGPVLVWPSAALLSLGHTPMTSPRTRERKLALSTLRRR